jgi:transcriptional regulator with XRE-family HTH domain
MKEKLYYEALQAGVQEAGENSRLAFYLRQLRSNPSRTLRQVAEESKVYRETISISLLADAEKGHVVPSAAKLITLAKIYRVSPQRFLDLIELDAIKPDGRRESLEEVEARAKQMFDLGEYAQAHALSEKALLMTQDEEHRAIIRKRKAVCLWKMGKTHWARDEFEAVLAHYGLPTEAKLSTYANLSAVFRQMRNFEMSRAMALQALALAQTLEDKKHRGIVQNTLGNLDMDLYEEQHRGDPALLRRATEHYLEAIACFEGDAPEARSQALVAMLNLGECYVLQGAAQRGFTCLKKAFQLSEDINNQRYIALSLNILGKCYHERGDFASAEGYLLKSDTIALQQGYNDLRFANNFYLWKIAKAEHNDIVERRTYKALCYLVKQMETDCLEVLEFLRLTQEAQKTDAKES